MGESDSGKYLKELYDLRDGVIRKDGTVDWRAFDEMTDYSPRVAQFLDYAAGMEVRKAWFDAVEKTVGLLLEKGILAAEPPYFALSRDGSMVSVNPFVMHEFWSNSLYFSRLEYARDYAAAVHPKEMEEINDIRVLEIVRIEDARRKK